MHLKVLFSFHFPLRFKSLGFLHFSFIPRLACAESDYNTLNLQETQSSPKCSLRSPYMWSLALSRNKLLPSQGQLPRAGPTQTCSSSTPIAAKRIQDGVCMRVASAFACRTKGIALLARMACPSFPDSVPFRRKGPLHLLWRSRDGDLPTNSSGHVLILSTIGKAVESQSWPD